jgi:hypothetical protein
VLAAGGGHVVYRRKRFEVSDPTIATGSDVLAAWPAPARLVLRLLRVDSVIQLRAVWQLRESRRQRRMELAARASRIIGPQQLRS